MPIPAFNAGVNIISSTVSGFVTAASDSGAENPVTLIIIFIESPASPRSCRFVWVTQHTRTFNEHWQKEGRPQPDEPFPAEDYLGLAFETMELNDVIWWEKSRDMMLTWACVAFLEFRAMKTPYYGVVFQTQKNEKVIQLVDYAKHLWRSSDEPIRRAFPLAKDLNRQSDHRLDFANGSYIVGIPGGASQIRSYHPAAYLNDESSFQRDAGECYNEAISAVADKIIFNSSAGPGWYADARRDIVRSE